MRGVKELVITFGLLVVFLVVFLSNFQFMVSLFQKSSQEIQKSNEGIQTIRYCIPFNNYQGYLSFYGFYTIKEPKLIRREIDLKGKFKRFVISYEFGSNLDRRQKYVNITDIYIDQAYLLGFVNIDREEFSKCNERIRNYIINKRFSRISCIFTINTTSDIGKFDFCIKIKTNYSEFFRKYIFVRRVGKVSSESGEIDYKSPLSLDFLIYDFNSDKLSKSIYLSEEYTGYYTYLEIKFTFNPLIYVTWLNFSFFLVIPYDILKIENRVIDRMRTRGISIKRVVEGDKKAIYFLTIKDLGRFKSYFDLNKEKSFSIKIPVRISQNEEKIRKIFLEKVELRGIVEYSTVINPSKTKICICITLK